MQTTTYRTLETSLPASARLSTRRPAPARYKLVTETPVTDLDIQSFIDGEADAATAHKVELAIKNDSRLRQRKNELNDQKRLLQLWWQQFF